MFNAYDFIGDIHGHSDVLEELLLHLGYLKLNGIYAHPEGRKALFIGDLIDRGPKILEVLKIVKEMVDSGNALIIIGNHEYNFICYFTIVEGKSLRSHSQKNNSGIRSTLEAMNHDSEIINYYVDWFRTLPIYIETETFRAVHAQWKQSAINSIKEIGVNDFSNTDFLVNSVKQNSPEYKIVNCLLKGDEKYVPGSYFHDKDGNKREFYRVKWWMKGDDFKPSEILFEFPFENIDNNIKINSHGYPETDVPIFFGHYCLKNYQIKLFHNNVCCLDYCISKHGKLVAYRFYGEKQLEEINYLSANKINS